MRPKGVNSVARNDAELEVRKAAGSYVCGEETAMLESIEGRRGIVRSKPPLPAIQGLFGQPTVINNVISFASVPLILARGAAFYRDYGVGRSRGTLPMQLAGNIKHGGLVEKAFGITPDTPETGYGYIQAGSGQVGSPAADGVRLIARFVEKPDAATAQRYLDDGSYLWNSGIDRKSVV